MKTKNKNSTHFLLSSENSNKPPQLILLILQMDTNIIKIEDSLENSTTLQNMNHPRGNINKQSFSYKKGYFTKDLPLIIKDIQSKQDF